MSFVQSSQDGALWFEVDTIGKGRERVTDTSLETSQANRNTRYVPTFIKSGPDDVSGRRRRRKDSP